MTEVKRVVCSKSKTCKPPLVHGVPSYCGGRVPHWRCAECGHCPHDPTAICIEVLVEDKREK
jgi:hypothetical protein